MQLCAKSQTRGYLPIYIIQPCGSQIQCCFSATVNCKQQREKKGLAWQNDFLWLFGSRLNIKCKYLCKYKFEGHDRLSDCIDHQVTMFPGEIHVQYVCSSLCCGIV